MMAAYAMDAVDHARNAFERDLDYSHKSVEAVEAILDMIYRSRSKGLFARLFRRGPSYEVLWTFSKMYGGYVGEVLRRAGGGQWYIDEHTMPGQKTLGLRKGGHLLWPPSKVEKRLTNGPEDNVWHYFQVVAREW